MKNFEKKSEVITQNDVSSFWQSKSRSTSPSTFLSQSRSPFDLKITLYATDIRAKLKAGQTLTQIPFICDDNILALLLYSFSKPNRNQNDILLIEHYLITFPNLMKTIYQKKYLYDASELLHKIAIYLKCEQIKRNTLICRLGEIGDKFYLIFQGSVGILIPRELKFRLSEEEFVSHLYKLFYLKEYELTLRTISSNNHIYMNPEIYQLKTQLESDDSLYKPSQYRESISIKDYIERLNPEANDTEQNQNPTITVWSYYYVTNITQGQTFGDIALSDDAKKRTATIIAIDNAYCGTLDITVYKNCIKDAQERIRKMNIHFLLANRLFNGIGNEFFDKRYFNFFKHVGIKRGEYLFTQYSVRNDIYFIKEGEIELYIKGSFKGVNEILNQKGETINTVGELYLTKKNPSFKKFYYELNKIFRIVTMAAREIVGLDEIIIKNDVYFCSAKCISEKAELFAIEYKLFLEIIKQEKRKDNLSRFIDSRSKFIIDRLKKMKTINIEKRFATYEGKKRKENYKLVPNKQYYQDLLENNRKHFRLEQWNSSQKRLYSAGNLKERNNSPTSHNKENQNKNIFSNVKKMSIITRSENCYFDDEKKTQNKQNAFSLYSLNKLRLPKTPIQEIAKTEFNDALTDHLYRDIIDKAIKKSNLFKNDHSYDSSINFLALDEAIEKKYTLKKTHSAYNLKSTEPKQLTMEFKGNKKILKYIKPPKPTNSKCVNTVYNNTLNNLILK